MKLLLLFAQLHITQPTIINQRLPVRKIEYRDTTKNYIILHNDGSSAGYKSTRNTLIHRRLQYHYYIKRDGTIVKLLDPKYKANHVGYSVWKGLIRLNRYSIGICLEDGIEKPYTDKQYTSVTWLIHSLQKRYPDKTTQIIVGHKDVALPFGRKTDPENFDWVKLKTLLAEGS